MRNFLHSPICPRVSIPRDLGGSCQTFYDLGSEVTQYYICHSLLWVTGPAESQHVRQLCEGMSVGGIIHWGPSLETNSQWVEGAVFGGKAQRRHWILGDSQRKSRSLPSEERGRKTKDERGSCLPGRGNLLCKDLGIRRGVEGMMSVLYSCSTIYCWIIWIIFLHHGFLICEMEIISYYLGAL